MEIRLPGKVEKIISVIEAAGFEAYAVGGCVRDSILNRIPNDWDITTSAKPEEVKVLFSHCIDTGIAHGTVTVMLGRDGFEITTYRIDGEYQDHRHPEEVTFTDNLREDLRRRDFTINAMAYHPVRGLVDLFDGLTDIRRQRIRAVGCARERFTEDALRILRAVRFASQLGYTIEEETMDAIRELSPTLSAISAERIQAELTKLLVSPHPEMLRVAYETGITKVILPEFDACMETPQNHPHHCYSVGEHILHTLQHIRNDKHLRLCMLLHDIGKPQTMTVGEDGITHFHGHASVSAALSAEILKRLKYDNETISRVGRLVEFHDYGKGVAADERFARRALNRIGADLFPDLFDVEIADILGQSTYMREEKLNNVERFREMVRVVSEKEQCVSLKTLAVTGKDLLALGEKPGKEIGEKLQLLLEHVLEVPEDNEKEKLLQLLKDLQA